MYNTGCLLVCTGIVFLIIQLAFNSADILMNLVKCKWSELQYPNLDIREWKTVLVISFIFCLLYFCAI